ncbi:unnamed protein product [Chironomus riparius]|uniref:Uncharacterized protein n=1 Tax=Chironomus riparius TaxID=315576 RepID=A0A9N9RJ67_9DIPT|nr:unnamed protein product [Chironomus riparius]
MIFKSFFGFKLEIGGLIIGWLGVILTGLLIPVCVVLMQVPYLISRKSGRTIDDNVTFSKVLIIILSAFISLLAFSCFIYSLLLRGISNRSHKKILPAVILLGTGLIGLGIGTLTSLSIDYSSDGILQVISGLLIYGYIFAIIYSLYVKIKDENKSKIIVAV